MTKKYEYKDKIYCDDDLSDEIENYGGNLYRLFLAAQEDRLVRESIFYVTDDGRGYESYEEFIENEFEEYEVNEDE